MSRPMFPSYNEKLKINALHKAAAFKMEGWKFCFPNLFDDDLYFWVGDLEIAKNCISRAAITLEASVDQRDYPWKRINCVPPCPLRSEVKAVFPEEHES